MPPCLHDAKREEIHRAALRLANIYYLRFGRIPALVKEIAQATSDNKAARERIPAGSFDGGEFLPGGGDKHPNKKVLNISKTIQHLHNNISSRRFGDGNCARNVRNALYEGGININPRPKHAKDYGPYLEKNGFGKITPTPPPNYNARAGDVVVIQNTTTSTSGHIAIFDGEVWYSDFRQRADIWPGPTYRAEKPSYEIFRFPRLIQKALLN